MILDILLTVQVSVSLLVNVEEGEGASASLAFCIHFLHLDSVNSELETFVEKKPDYCTETLRAFILAIDS